MRKFDFKIDKLNELYGYFLDNIREGINDNSIKIFKMFN